MLVTKHSGDLVPFDKASLYRSLSKSGASAHEVEAVYAKLEPQLFDKITTRKLYELAFKELKAVRSSYAARYSLKKALRDLGPEGFYFEKWVARVFEYLGFHTQTGLTLQGHAVTHEIDVLASNAENLHIAECKFRNDIDAKISVTTPMYYLSRIKDLKDLPFEVQGKECFIKHGWLITNAYLTKDSKAFASYYGIKVVSWDYPENNNIKSITDQYGLYPVTALTYISDDDKKALLKKGILLVLDINPNHSNVIKSIVSEKEWEAIYKEAQELLVK